MKFLKKLKLQMFAIFVVGCILCSCAQKAHEAFSDFNFTSLANLSPDNGALILDANSKEKIIYSTDGIELEAVRATKKEHKDLLPKMATKRISIAGTETLKQGQSLAVLLHYRYPKVPMDRLRWLRLQIGDYEVSIHKDINLIDLKNPKKQMSEYLTPFSMIGRGDTDIWVVATHLKNKIRLVMMKKDNPEYAVTCSWDVRDMNNPVTSFGMYSYLPAIQHKGPSHLFKLVGVGHVNENVLPGLRNIPIKSHRAYIKNPNSLANIDANIKADKNQNKDNIKSKSRVGNLKLKFDGPVTSKELNQFKDYYAFNIPLAGFDRNFGNFYNPNIGRWLYQKTNDITIVNRTIEGCERGYLARNDINPNLKVSLATGISLAEGRVKDVLPPVWPQYNVRWFDDQDKIGVGNAAAQSSGVVWPAVCARTIAENKTIWNQIYSGTLKRFKGMKYREIAMILLERSKVVFDYYIDEYIEHPDRDKVIEDYVPKDKQVYTTCDVFAGEKIGVHPYFNRILPLILAKQNASEAYKAFDMEKEYANRLKQIVVDNMDYIKSYMFVIERNGNKILTHPYSAYNHPSPKMKAEDSGHGSMDGRAFTFLYEDGYLSDDTVSYYANSVVNMYQGNGLFSLHINGEGKELAKDIYSAGEGLFYLAKFNPEVKECLWKTHYQGKPLQVYAILKTREALYGIGNE
ncbi:hypothetical protein VOI54_17410 [Tamlana sp. 2201CG12-4]|uniref:hypothetical protein n=1 Tax=Tamlana sp. 2201CG12-4 TaxID=3112582 RepID=UPI002DC03C41|nr:hypothetical protein [Tamlana sp. 2201CG12-4]MEC3908809.1 hypothetical protein [Tamlana sp. 2201CG12-4]